VRRRSEKYVAEGSEYAHWIGLYLGFHLNWVLGQFVHGRLQNLQTSEVTFAHAITHLIRILVTAISTFHDSYIEKLIKGKAAPWVEGAVSTSAAIPHKNCYGWVRGVLGCGLSDYCCLRG